MGRFLCVGIAKSLAVKKEYHEIDDIIEELRKSVDLSIYDKPKEGKSFIFFEMKKEYIEKYAIPFVEEQIKIALENIPDKSDYNRINGSLQKLLNDAKNKNFQELLEMAKEQRHINFQLIEGSLFSNDISYISNRLTIIADIISYLSDGKIFMETYFDMFRYLRNTIIRSSNNPIKTSAMISIIG